MRAVVIAALPVAAPAFGGGAREKPPQLKELRGLSKLAPRVGFEPTTLRLTAGCSAVELPRNEPARGARRDIRSKQGRRIYQAGTGHAKRRLEAPRAPRPPSVAGTCRPSATRACRRRLRPSDSAAGTPAFATMPGAPHRRDTRAWSRS